MPPTTRGGTFGMICACLAATFNFTGGLILSFVRFGVIVKDHHSDFDINKLKVRFSIKK